MISWQERYDNLLPEDFLPKPITTWCNTHVLEEFLSSFYEDEQEKFEKQLAKEGAVTPSQIKRKRDGE